jgi:hypothetical protein
LIPPKGCPRQLAKAGTFASDGFGWQAGGALQLVLISSALADDCPPLLTLLVALRLDH